MHGQILAARVKLRWAFKDVMLVLICMGGRRPGAELRPSSK
jgi:hypothetical protein